MLKLPPETLGKKVVGIFGDPVVHSLSPKMHNYAFQKLNLNFIYLAFEVKPFELRAALDDIRRLKLAGINVTIPHKEKIFPLMDDCTPEAKMIGAVNTVINIKGELVGHNTDGKGFISSLKKDGDFQPKDKSAVIWGTGGAARAMAFSLLESGVKNLTLINRTPERAVQMRDYLIKKFPQKTILALETTADDLLSRLKSCDLFISTAPCGIEENFPFPPGDFLSSKIFVYDAVYAKDTPLLKAAKNLGAKCLGGEGMLIRQGALAFALWTGEESPVSLMREALNSPA